MTAKAKKAKAPQPSEPSRKKRDKKSIAPEGSNGHAPAPPTAVEVEERLDKLRAKHEDAYRLKESEREQLEADIRAAEHELAAAQVREIPMPSDSFAKLVYDERDIALDAIVVTGNHREAIDQAESLRLARSIQLFNLQQRVGLRAVGDGAYELIFGSRRRAAFALIGRTHIPAKVYPSSLTPVQVELLRTIENFGRKDLTAVERAMAVARVIDQINATIDRGASSHRAGSLSDLRSEEERAEWRRMFDAEKVAKDRPELGAALGLQQAMDAAGGLHAYVGQQLGFTPKWVKDHAYVAGLGGTARRLLAEHRIDVGHARELAKLGDPKEADGLAELVARDEAGLGGRDVEYLRARVVEQLRSLRVVPWRLDVAFGHGVPGCTGQACVTCKFNSKSDPDLFGGALADEPEAGYCTNAACFAAKQSISEKDLAATTKKIASAVKRSPGMAVNESLATQLAPVHLKAASAARKAKKEIDAAVEGKAPATALARKQTPEEIAEDKHRNALIKWSATARKTLIQAVLDDPLKLQVMALLEFSDGIERMDDFSRDREEESFAACSELLKLAADKAITPLAELVAVEIRKREKWRQRIPAMEGFTSDLFVDALARGWTLPVKPMPRLEEFLPKPKTEAKADAAAKGTPEGSDDFDDEKIADEEQVLCFPGLVGLHVLRRRNGRWAYRADAQVGQRQLVGHVEGVGSYESRERAIVAGADTIDTFVRAQKGNTPVKQQILDKLNELDQQMIDQGGEAAAAVKHAASAIGGAA